MKNRTTLLSRDANDRLSQKLCLLSAVLLSGNSTRWCHQKSYRLFTVFSATFFTLLELLEQQYIPRSQSARCCRNTEQRITRV